MSNNDFEKNLFLAQYNQVYEQRRQHVGLYWKIPTVAAAVVTLAVHKLDFAKLNVCTLYLLIVPLLMFSYGVLHLFFRHNYFQKVYGLLLQKMDKDEHRKPLKPSPQFGPDFKKPEYQKKMKQWWEKLGEKSYGINSWLWIMAAAVFYILLIWFDLVNLPTKILGFLRSADWSGLFKILKRIVQFIPQGVNRS